MGNKREPLPWYSFEAKHGGDTADLDIFGEIGGGFFFDEDAITGKAVAAQLGELPDSVARIRVRVNSGGGNVFDAIQIANELRRQREEKGRTIDVEIDALAASAATIITSAGSTISMPRNAIMMVHNPSVGVVGDAEEMRSVAGALDKIKGAIVSTYRWVSSLSAKKLGDLMDATTWMDADEALANGLVTDIAKPVKVTASLGRALLEQFDIPEQYKDRIMALVEPEQTGNGAPKARTQMSKNVTPITPPAPVTPAAVTTDPPAPASVPATVPDSAAVTAATNAERARNAGIRNAVGIAIAGGLDRQIANGIETSALEDGQTVDQTRSKLFDQLVQPTPGPSPGPADIDIEGGEEEHDKRVRGITAALISRAGKTRLVRDAAAKNPDHPVFRNMSFDPGEFRGMSLLDHCRAAIERMPANSGRHPTGEGSTKGLTKTEIAQRFLNVGGQQTTSDFPVAFEEALNKVLLAAYLIASDTWRRFCSVGTVSDFRAHNRYRGAFLSRLDELEEGTEIRNKTIPDATKEVQQAKTFANILSLTRKAIVNDDMGLFNDVATKFGRAAALSIELGVYDLLAENAGLGPDMNDGNPLFDATHNNIGTGAAISVAQLDADRVIMATQTDSSGNEVLDLRPDVLLLPIGLGGAARVIIEAQFDTDVTNQFQVPNKVLGIVRDIVDSPRITGTRQYLFADPAVAPTIEVAFLEGQEEPDVEMMDGWRTDGVEWKVVHDFGVAAVDFRGAVTNAGV